MPSNRKTTFILLASVLFVIIGCVSRKEIQQFQVDHSAIQRKQELIELKQDSIQFSLGKLESQLDSIYSVMGGNVDESFAIQKEILRGLRADSRAVSSDLNRMLETLGARITDSDIHTRRLITKLDEVNLLLSKFVESQDTTGAMAQFDVNDPERLYQQSYFDFTSGETELARMGFNQYLALYPNTSLTDNALYWVGETYLAEDKSDSAKTTFEQLVHFYPTSQKIPTALFKLGLIYSIKGNLTKAEESFLRIRDEFPNSSEADKARERLVELEEIKPDTTNKQLDNKD